MRVSSRLVQNFQIAIGTPPREGVRHDRRGFGAYLFWPVVERVHEGCRNHRQGVELERRERGILSQDRIFVPFLLVECEAGKDRTRIAAGTDKRRHARELFRLHERDDSVAGTSSIQYKFTLIPYHFAEKQKIIPSSIQTK